MLGSTILPYTLGLIWAIDLNQGVFKGAEFLRGVTLVNWIIPGNGHRLPLELDLQRSVRYSK